MISQVMMRSIPGGCYGVLPPPATWNFFSMPDYAITFATLPLGEALASMRGL